MQGVFLVIVSLIPVLCPFVWHMYVHICNNITNIAHHLQVEAEEQDAFFLQESDEEPAAADAAAGQAATAPADKVSHSIAQAGSQPAQSASNLGKRPRTTVTDLVDDSPADVGQLQKSAAGASQLSEPAGGGTIPSVATKSVLHQMQHGTQLQRAHVQGKVEAKHLPADNGANSLAKRLSDNDTDSPAKRPKTTLPGATDSTEPDSTALAPSGPKASRLTQQQQPVEDDRREAAAAAASDASPASQQLPAASGLHAHVQPSTGPPKLRTDDVFFDDSSDSDHDLGSLEPPHGNPSPTPGRNHIAGQPQHAVNTSKGDPSRRDGNHPGSVEKSRRLDSLAKGPMAEWTAKPIRKFAALAPTPAHAASDEAAAPDTSQRATGSQSRLARLQALAAAIQRKHQPPETQLPGGSEAAAQQFLDHKSARGGAHHGSITAHGRPDRGVRSDDRADRAVRQAHGDVQGGRGRGSARGGSRDQVRGRGRGRGRNVAVHQPRAQAGHPAVPNPVLAKPSLSNPGLKPQQAGSSRVDIQHDGGQREIGKPESGRPRVPKEVQKVEKHAAAGAAPAGDTAAKGRTRAEGGRKRRKKN